MTPDNPLYFITQIPPKYRLPLYLIASLIALGFSIWQMTDGNPVAFVTLLVLSLVHAMSALYVPQSPKDGPPKGEENATGTAP